MTNEIANPRRAAVDKFLEQARKQASSTPSRGRLIFALDATASRQPTWDHASHLQAEMFKEVPRGLDIQLCYFRGDHECQASRWLSDSAVLRTLMEGIDCKSGHTQIQRVLEHARREHAKEKVSALVYVGDCVEEIAGDLYDAARGLTFPVFCFHEGDELEAARTFREIAHITKGAYCPFDSGSAQQLAQLLRAVAIFATGGKDALLASGNAAATLLLQQLK